MDDELTEEERKVLAVEAAWWREGGRKATVIQEAGMSTGHYYLVLNRAISKPAAIREDPELIRRLTSLRAKRALERHGNRGN